MSIQCAGVIGAGTMGNGIAQACAVAGIAVVMTDISETALAKGMSTISNSLDRLIKKEKMTVEQKAKALSLIKGSNQLADLKVCDIVIEAATENLELKLKILKDVEALLGPNVILASNTSSISITRMAAASGRPEKFIGMHFFNPVPLMELVELIRALQTSDDTHAQAEDLAKRLGKTAVVDCRDLEVIEREGTARLAGDELRAGAWLSIDGRTGNIFLGRIPTLARPASPAPL